MRSFSLSALWKELRRYRMGMAAFIVLAMLYLGAVLAPFLAPYSSADQDLARIYHPPAKIVFKEGGLHAQIYENTDRLACRWEPAAGRTAPIRFFAKGREYKLLGFIPCSRHLFQVEEGQRIYLLGSDGSGRDVFSRLLFGSQISLAIGFLGIVITMTLGFLAGGLSGYFGGAFDFVAMRFCELVMAIPGLYLLLALRAAFVKQGLSSAQMFAAIVVILAFIRWAGTARIIRGMALSISRQPFVLAAETMGQSAVKILLKHILPNVASYLLVAATLSIPGYILGEAALSYLGLGIQEPSASWGLMLSQAQEMKTFMLGFWWLLTPGLAIFITVIAFNVLGDALRDIVDPKMRV